MPTNWKSRSVCLALALGIILLAVSTVEAIPRQEKATFEVHLDRTAYDAGTRLRWAGVMEIEEGWHTNSHTPTFEYLIPTAVTFTLPEGWSEPELDYPAGELKTFAFEEQPISVYEGETQFSAEWQLPESLSAGEYLISAELRYQACDDRSCLPPVRTVSDVTVTVGPGGTAVSSALFTDSAGGDTSPSAPAERSLPMLLLLAALGGLILNAMPCVLPVLSLKALSLVKSAGQSRAMVTSGALATSAGIILSFLALAIAAIVAKQAGNAVGWGVQFQQPGFVAALAVVVTLFCLNLWGLFEIQLPSRVTTAAGSMGGQGLGGHFVSGLFATLMATPCSAPFLGTAVGFALGQSASTILTIFFAIGFGMSLPYLILATVPKAADWLPKPGAWMERVKGAMGFLLAAAAIWLLYVLAAQVSAERLAFVELGLLGLALFLWLRHHTGPGAFRTVTLAASFAAAIFTVWTATSGTRADASALASNEHTTGLIAWSEFDQAEAESLTQEGRLVFVDVTADWCFTCKVNERLVLETPQVAEVFEKLEVVAMQADWTNRNDEIAEFLASHGRSGIPFYMLYRPDAPPHVFGELISKEGIVSVLEEASAATRLVSTANAPQAISLP